MFDSIIYVMKGFINMESLTSSLFGAFFGALFAYWFSAKQQSKKERDDRLGFLTFAVSSMSGLVGALYVAKKNFVIPRNHEMQAIKNSFAQLKPEDGAQVIVKMKALTMLMHTSKFALPFQIEKINFIARKSPNVVYILYALSSSIEELNQIIYDYNAYLSELVNVGAQVNASLIFDYAKNLSGQVDEALYLSEKAQAVLMQYGKIYYKNDFKIKSIDIDKEWIALKPSKMDSWEEAEFFPKTRRYQKSG